MTAPTTSRLRALTLSGLAAVALFAAPAAALAQNPDRGSAETARPCRGQVTTLAWGAYVGDAEGRCSPRPPVAARRPSVTVARPESCADERRWLGGAVRVCRDAPRAERRR